MAASRDRLICWPIRDLFRLTRAELSTSSRSCTPERSARRIAASFVFTASVFVALVAVDVVFVHRLGASSLGRSNSARVTLPICAAALTRQERALARCHPKPFDGRGVKYMHFLARPSERDVEHSLDVLAVRLPGGDCRLLHIRRIIRKRVKDYVALVALKPVRVHYYEVVSL